MRINGLVMQKRDKRFYQGIEGDSWYLNYDYLEGIDTYFTEHIEKAWEHSDYIDVCHGMEYILRYIDTSQKKNIDYRVLACMSEKKFPQMDLLSGENMIFLGYDYAYSGGSYYSAVLNDVVSKRIPTFAGIHLNAYGLFETYEEILEFANSRNRMGKAEPFQKEYLEKGDFVIYKRYEMKTYSKDVLCGFQRTLMPSDGAGVPEAVNSSIKNIGKRKCNCGGLIVDISYYYQILDIGILYEKGRQEGKRWKIGERKRLSKEVSFWIDLLGFIADEENGIECSEKLFESLRSLCKKYKFPNYEKMIEQRDEMASGNCVIMRNKDDELKIYNLIKHLLLDLQKNIDDHKDKEVVYRMLRVLHNLPKSMHGRNVLNVSCNVMSYHDALTYAQSYMDEKMKEQYRKYFD